MNRRDNVFPIVYPDARNVSADWILSMASDRLANDYMEKNQDADDAAIQENARVRSVSEAIDILDDAGDVTFRKGCRELARDFDEFGGGR